MVIKCKRALHATNLKRLAVAGGVGANKMLRENCVLAEKKMLLYIFHAWNLHDNGAMIAMLAASDYRQASDDLNIKFTRVGI